MKKTLLLLFCFPMIGFGQTQIPDVNFEQALINLGYDTGTPDGSVPTTNINSVTTLYVSNQSISDLTGIQDFTALTDLDCSANQLTSLDISQNTALTILLCEDNQLTNLDVSQNTALTFLWCSSNQLTSLDVSQNTALNWLYCHDNQLTNLDVSQNTTLNTLLCNFNQLTVLDVSQNTVLGGLDCSNNGLICLDISQNIVMDTLMCDNNLLEQLNTKNGQGVNEIFSAMNNNLTCIEADNVLNPSWNVDQGVVFNTNCNYTTICPTISAIEEHTRHKELLKVIDLLGRESKRANQPLFYIYDDGTVEKRIHIE